MSTAPVEDAPPPPSLFARVSHRLARHIPLSRLTMRNGPIVSFTFDDIPASAHRAGAEFLEAHGIRGTFYIASGLFDGQTANWQVAGEDAVADLHRRGHEIACHTHTHRRADTIHGDDIDAEIAENRERLHAIEPSLKLDNFAYPYGYGSFAWKRKLKEMFHTSRGVCPGINCGKIDLQFLKAFPLTNADLDEDAIRAIMDETVRTQGWTIFYTHDVAFNPSPYGCTYELLSAAVRAAQERGIACMTVAGALARIRARRPGQIR
jgi:peptidoglycan/xylan/chitin deacetylase (PgdA/CDA1 family)